MKYLKNASICLAVFLLFLLYYFSTNKLVIKTHHNVLNKIKWNRKRTIYNGNYLIKTPGCSIPDYYKELNYTILTTESSCGQRAIDVKKISEVQLQFKIDNLKMKRYAKTKKYTCCYQTITRAQIARGTDNYLNYSSCINFKSGTKIKFQYEVIKVTCTEQYKNDIGTIYEDVYIIVKKVKVKQINKNTWNVMLYGIENMSRTRFYKTMPRTAQFLKNNGWLDFKGYHTVHYDAFPNRMAILTGKNASTIQSLCKFGMDYCINDTLWTMFKEAGYITAYGENFIHSEKFAFSKYNGFAIMPTEHYMRPFFLTGEVSEDNIFCSKQLPSVTHLLDYSLQFINVYKNENFFGTFWHNANNDSVEFFPKFIDNTFTEMLMKLNKTGVLHNTFLILISNHGITSGHFKLSISSYYEERLPMLFIWVPYDFRKRFQSKYQNLKTNQNSLTLPYDIFATLYNILNFNSSHNTLPCTYTGCQSLFEKISLYRSCSSAGLDEKWCTCHDIMESDESRSKEALNMAVLHIQGLSTKVDTIPFTVCETLELERVIRIHTYFSGGKEYTVIAFTMTPGNRSFEALVEKDGDKHNILEPIEGISAYNERSSCVIDTNNKPFCVCKMTSPCDNIVY